MENSSLILVAVINNPRDLEIARVLGWYRIPLKSAPKVVAVDFLAFYQTGAFGEEKWRINYIAPVRGHELTTRLDLLQDEPDHPHAHHEYYRIQLGPLAKLPKSIAAQRWRRITFFYTTGEYLSRANTIDDLVIHSSERPLLWRALRERGDQALTTDDEVYSGDWDNFSLAPDMLAKILGLQEADHLK
jgi:hypothetical protein